MYGLTSFYKNRIEEQPEFTDKELDFIVKYRRRLTAEPVYKGNHRLK